MIKSLEKRGGNSEYLIKIYLYIQNEKNNPKGIHILNNGIPVENANATEININELVKWEETSNSSFSNIFSILSYLNSFHNLNLIFNYLYKLVKRSQNDGFIIEIMIGVIILDPTLSYQCLLRSGK